MKKSFLISIAIFCFVTGNSQESAIIIGLQSSPVLTDMRQDFSYPIFRSMFSFAIGLSLEYYLTPNISLKTNLSFERNRIISDAIIGDIYGSIVGLEKDVVKQSSDYVKIPLLVSFSGKGNYKLYVNAGPYIGFLLSQKVDIMMETPSQPWGTYIEDLKPLDLGISFGFGLTHSIGDRLIIDIGLRDDLGMYDINKSKRSYISNPAIKTNSFALNLGIKYKCQYHHL